MSGIGIAGGGVILGDSPATPGGSDTQVQYNDGGAFGGSAALTFDDTSTAPVLAVVVASDTAAHTPTVALRHVDGDGTSGHPAGAVFGKLAFQGTDTDGDVYDAAHIIVDCFAVDGTDANGTPGTLTMAVHDGAGGYGTYLKITGKTGNINVSTDGSSTWDTLGDCIIDAGGVVDLQSSSTDVTITATDTAWLIGNSLRLRAFDGYIPMDDGNAAHRVRFQITGITAQRTLTFPDYSGGVVVNADALDPGADRLVFWDDSAGTIKYLTPGTNLAITGTTIDAANSAGVEVQEADVTKVAAATTLDFDGNFIVSESPTGEANVAVRWNSIDVSDLNISSASDFGCFIDGDIEWTAGGDINLSNYTTFFSDNHQFSATVTRLTNPGGSTIELQKSNFVKAILQLSALTADRTFTFPDSDGTLALASGVPANLDDLTDVVITTPADNDLLTYDSGTSKWVNTAGAGGYTDEQAQDAVGAMVADGTSVGLTYTDATPSLIANIKIASEAQGDIIYHNGTQWTRLGAGTSGHFLKTQGAGANPTWAAASGGSGALTLIASSSPSGAASVSFDGCFTGTYENYLIVANGAMSAAADMLLRLRASSSDATGSDYAQGGARNYPSGSDTQSGNARTSFLVLSDGGITPAALEITMRLAKPNVATQTTITGESGHYRGSGGDQGISLRMGGAHKLATAYDGFTLFPSSGTYTGTVRVYGLADS